MWSYSNSTVLLEQLGLSPVTVRKWKLENLHHCRGKHPSFGGRGGAGAPNLSTSHVNTLPACDTLGLRNQVFPCLEPGGYAGPVHYHITSLRLCSDSSLSPGLELKMKCQHQVCKYPQLLGRLCHALQALTMPPAPSF